MKDPSGTVENTNHLSTKDSANPDDLTGKVLNDFQLVRRLGQGGMGQVYLARQISLKRQVAIKILRPELAANSTALQRFRREAEAVAGITHANIVQIYQIGECENLHFMVLEYIEGRNLRDYIAKKGPPDLPIALNIMRQVAAALQRAGELGFVHRDIKPENILLTRKGEVKVTDFGLSRGFLSQEPLNLTQSGITMGTPLYMSPEQVQGKPIDPRSDIYSFGVTCYHLFAGEPPFRGSSAFEVALQHVQSIPRPLQGMRPDLPKELCDIVHKMMAKEVTERYQTPREISRDLLRLKELLAQGQTTAVAINELTSSETKKLDSSVVPSFVGFGNEDPNRSSQRKPLIGIAVLVLAIIVGFAAHWIVDSSTPMIALPGESDNKENAYLSWLEKEKQQHLSRIDNPDIKREKAAQAVLDLLMLYIQEKKWSDAEDFLKTLAKRPSFQGTEKGLKGMGTNLYPMVMERLGRAIVLSHQDEPKASNEVFEKILPSGSGKGKEDRLPINAFFGMNPKWKKEVADAIDRNAKNLEANGRKLPDGLERYRVYLPRNPMPK